MNRLIKLLSGCDLEDVASLRALSANGQGNVYALDTVRITCEETQRITPEIVRFLISIPLTELADPFDEHVHGLVVADYCLRLFAAQLREIALDKLHNTKKERFTGKIYFHQPNNKVLLRNSAYVAGGHLHLVVKIKFPVHMMSQRNVVNGKLSVRIVKKELTKAIWDFMEAFDKDACAQRIAVYARQQEIRRIMRERAYIAFLANNSILPRREYSEQALEGAVPFCSPQEDAVTLQLEDGTALTGMAVRQGITVVTGGGYSGKSTLLNAMLNGIYDHIPGDGREYCLTERRCAKIIAEDGRRVDALDITPFIRSTPFLPMKAFSTEHASGSTSQAANIMEAIAFGCSLLLIDEDRTATNFMMRDARMKTLIQNDPIVPFTDRARQLYREAGISTVLIIGGSSEYLDIADHVYFMENYRLRNFTQESEQLRAHPYTYFDVRDPRPISWQKKRVLAPGCFTAFTRNAESGKYKEDLRLDGALLCLGDLCADTARIESLISQEQRCAILWMCRYLASHSMGKALSLADEVGALYAKIQKENFSFLLSSAFAVDDVLELPHLPDILSVISRMSFIQFIKDS